MNVVLQCVRRQTGQGNKAFTSVEYRKTVQKSSHFQTQSLVPK